MVTQVKGVFWTDDAVPSLAASRGANAGRRCRVVGWHSGQGLLVAGVVRRPPWSMYGPDLVPEVGYRREMTLESTGSGCFPEARGRCPTVAFMQVRHRSQLLRSGPDLGPAGPWRRSWRGMGSSGSDPCAARLLRSPAWPEAVVVLPPRCLGALCLLLCGGGVCARARDRRWGSRPAAWVFHQQWGSGENAALGTLSMGSWYTAGESCHSVSPITRRERRESPSRRVKSRGTAIRWCRLGPAWRPPPGYWAQRRYCAGHGRSIPSRPS